MSAHGGLCPPLAHNQFSRHFSQPPPHIPVPAPFYSTGGIPHYAPYSHTALLEQHLHEAVSNLRSVSEKGEETQTKLDKALLLNAQLREQIARQEPEIERLKVRS